jgi:hypothetical protein
MKSLFKYLALLVLLQSLANCTSNTTKNLNTTLQNSTVAEALKNNSGSTGTIFEEVEKEASDYSS